MAFDWNNVGPAPNADEIEVAVFGPGYGECIVVHVGLGRWLVVDSCIDSSDRNDQRPVAEKYLRKLGVDLAASVDLLVATHWHADHVRGLGRLVELCPNAKFSCANAMVQQEFVTFIEEMSTASIATNGAKLTDFREAIQRLSERSQVIRFATGGKVLSTWGQRDQPVGFCEVLSLSPSDREYELFLTEVTGSRPAHGQSKKAAAASTPNLVSVVLHLKFSSTAVLLGADMESHHDPQRGWSAAIAEAQSASRPKADLLKIPHHGSHTGHHEGIWTITMQPKPVGVVTPFNRMPDTRKLPTADDIVRLKEHTSELYLTAPQRLQQARGRETAVDRSLKEHNIQIRSASTPLGMMRFRFQNGAVWSREVFPPASQLHP